jgi:hypothetical protein
MKYDEKLLANPKDSLAIAGKVKCLEALGRWEESCKLCEESLFTMKIESEVSHSNTHTKAAVIGARAAWSLNQWNLMDDFVSQLPVENVDGSFMKAILAIHHENYSDAKKQIEVTRSYLDKSISALMTESYGRAYMPLIMVQQCSELEEIMEYKLFLKENGLISISNANGFGTTIEGENSGIEIFGSVSAMGGNIHDYSNIDNMIFSNCFYGLEDFNGIPRKPLSSRHESLSDQVSYSFSSASSTTAHSSSAMAGGVDGSRNFDVVSPSIGSGIGGGNPSSAANNETNTVNRKFLIDEANCRKRMLSEKWRRRIRGCSATGRNAIPYWKFLLNGRKMILNEREDLDTWLDFVSLCRNCGNSSLAERVLSMSQQHLSLDITGGGGSVSSPHIPSIAMMRSPILSSSSSSQHDDDIMIMERRIKFAMLKQQWNKGDRVGALLGLDHLVRSTRLSSNLPSVGNTSGGGFSSLASVSASPPGSTASMLNTGSMGGMNVGTGAGGNQGVDSSYLSCLLKLGEWKVAILDPGVAVDLPTRMEVLQLYSRATLVDPNSYRASHSWGLCNYRAIEEIRNANKSLINSLASSSSSSSATSISAITPSAAILSRSNHTTPGSRSSSSSSNWSSGAAASTQPIPLAAHITRDQFISYIVNAIKGLMKALTMGSRKFSSSVMQDMLCILSLWFRYGRLNEVNTALEGGLSTVAIDNWLGVLPQLIARIDHPDKDTRHLLHNLLMRLGSKHAQALVYPLSVALKSERGDRKEAAESLMNGLRQNSPKLIDQALLVSQELVRVAISWEESWHWGLEDASRQCFGEGNCLFLCCFMSFSHCSIRC